MSSRSEVHYRVDAGDRLTPVSLRAYITDMGGLHTRGQHRRRRTDRGAHVAPLGNKAREQGAPDEAGGARNEDLLWNHWGSGGTASRGGAILGRKPRQAAGRINA